MSINKTDLKKYVFSFLFSLLPIQANAACNYYNASTNVLHFESLSIFVNIWGDASFAYYGSLDFIDAGACDSPNDSKQCLTLDFDTVRGSLENTCTGNDIGAVNFELNGTSLSVSGTTGSFLESYAIYNRFSRTYDITIPVLDIDGTEYFDAKFTFPVMCGGNKVCLRFDTLDEMPETSPFPFPEPNL
jgi:hypothetical protein